MPLQSEKGMGFQPGARFFIPGLLLPKTPNERCVLTQRFLPADQALKTHLWKFINQGLAKWHRTHHSNISACLPQSFQTLPLQQQEKPI